MEQNPEKNLRLKAQRFWDFLVFLPFSSTVFSLFRFAFRYRIENLRETRAFYREVTQSFEPLLICSNHLTYIDSIIIIWALGNPWWYFWRYRAVSWNLPAAEYSRSSLFFRLVGYCGKCLFIERKGTRGQLVATLNTTRFLLERGEVVTIFPEGTRSRTGYFNEQKLVNGAGKVIFEMKRKCRVLCLYVRGDKQTNHSNFPPKNSSFQILYELIEPVTSKEGKEAYVELVSQIGKTIKGLESRHFSL